MTWNFRTLQSERVAFRTATALGCIFAITAVALPVHAQDAATDTRLKKVEAEVRALQRKVFPGGGDKYFQPEITPGVTAPATGSAPSTTAVTDLLTRMQAVEAQLARLTSHVEQNTNRLDQLEARLNTANPATGMSADPQVGPMQTVPAPITPNGGETSVPAAQPKLRPATAAAAPASATTTKAVAKPSDARLQAVSAIVKPQTTDAGDDEYSYGFRLWEARFYPEAEQQLKLFLEKYPNHARTSWGRNLLGRAYLDDGNPLEAAKWFVQNYQADKRGDRAPDSLLYLAVSMKQLKDTNRACIALAEFSTNYPSEAAGRLRSVYESTRNGITCKA